MVNNNEVKKKTCHIPVASFNGNIQVELIKFKTCSRHIYFLFKFCCLCQRLILTTNNKLTFKQKLVIYYMKVKLLQIINNITDNDNITSLVHHVNNNKIN